MINKPKRIQVKETKRYYGEIDGSLESIIASLQAELDVGVCGDKATLKDGTTCRWIRYEDDLWE